LGRLVPDTGTVAAREGVCCEQRCDDPPAGFEFFCGSCEGSARRLAGEFSIEPDWHERWESLSFGERKRAQIATALWHEPEILALDEPTNHLDRAARLLLVEALSRYRGTGLLVSHDRELLEALPYQCLHLDPPHAVMRPGNYFDGKIQAEMEREYALAQKEKIAANISRLQRDAAVRRGLACSADRLRSKKGLCKKDHDAREKIDRARISGKDGVQGKILRQLDGRIRQEQERLESISAKRDADSRIFFRDAPLRGGYVLSMEDGIIPMCNRTIRHPLLSVRRGEKIAVMGPNGSGKTTLLQHIRQLVPDAFFIAQEISAEQSRETLGTVLRMEKEPRGRILTAVENLGTDVKRLLATDQPSPGE
ncbi:MAG: ATP-binding cassette domain-containing protein, partial [Spirochaetota bacterium]